jgi:hypothetical protein
MGRNEGLHRVDHRAPVTLKGVGNVIELEAEQELNKPVGNPVDQEFMQRIVNYFASTREPGAKDTLIAFFEFAEVTDEVLRIVRRIRHEDGHGIPSTVLDSGAHGHTEAMPAIVVNQHYIGVVQADSTHQSRSIVRASVINYHDFTGDSVLSESHQQALDCIRDATGFISSGNYYRHFHV